MFIDQGFGKGDTFTRAFLRSDEFLGHTLKSLAPPTSKRKRGSRRPKADKDSYASGVADAFADGRLDASDLLVAYSGQPRTWLTFLTGSHSKRPRMPSADLLLAEMGDEEWHGPLTLGSGYDRRQWFFRPFQVDHFAPERVGGPLVRLGKARWLVVAEVGVDYAALHWDGYSRYPELGAKNQRYFEFWKEEYLPTAVNELGKALGASWTFAPLSPLVLDHLWATYVDDDDYAWEHLCVRADAQGVAVNARSARRRGMSKRGLKAFTSALSGAAVKALGIKSSSVPLAKVENALLRVLIHEWGTRSYEFSLNERVAGSTSEKLLFHGHCYFGNKPHGQDSLVHVHCFADYGGSIGALEFLRRALDASGLA